MLFYRIDDEMSLATPRVLTIMYSMISWSVLDLEVLGRESSKYNAAMVTVSEVCTRLIAGECIR